ncbi:hypothetical protein DD237_004764 [Peronospora effusa]|uniref:PX domain-containing protein n=1 Tax=Peronospora effusa TaxID=542832 RepID=A0A425C622_9STRA|nr:hypothetical protein DD237_004764 [Peronospora effusa]
MGCRHSIANEVSIDPTTQPPSGYGKVSMDIVFTDIIVDETSKSVPLVEEEVEEYEKQVIVTTPAAEDKPIPTEELVKVVVEEFVVVNESIVVEEAVVVEAEMLKEPTRDEALVKYETKEEVEQHEEKSLMLEEFAVTNTSAPVWTFVAEKVAFTVGVAFFNISGCSPDGEKVHLTKRYSEFKVLHAEMVKLMSKEELIDLPGTSFLQGRNDKALLQEREDAFVKILNAIAQHPKGFQSAAFTAFLAQSKTTTDEVVERVSKDTFTVEVLANTDVSAPAIAIEDPPASTEEEPPTVCASVSINDVEEEEPAAAPIEGEVKKIVEFAAEGEEVEKEVDFAAAAGEEKVEIVTEFGAAHVEEVVKTDAASSVKETLVLNCDAPVEEVAETLAHMEEVAETSASVEEVAETSASVEEVAETSASVEEVIEAVASVKEVIEVAASVEEVFEVAASVEEVAPKLEDKGDVEAFTLQSAPLVESSVLKLEAEVEALIQEEDEPKSEVMAVAPESETKVAESSLVFKAANVTFNDKGVAFYNFDGSDLSNPVNDVHISKRYSDFKALHAQLTGKGSKVTDLPALPAASFLQGRNNRKLLEERKSQFTILLNAIAAHPIALHSDVFKAFLATSDQITVEASDAAVVQQAKTKSVKSEALVDVDVKTFDFALQFVPGEVSTNEYGIAFYNFDGSNPADPNQEVHVCKRYSEFKRMHAEISKLMASEDQFKFQTCPTLPSMPRANAVTFVLGRGNQNVVKEREAQFVKILNAVAAHPTAFQSKSFTEMDS